MHPLLRSSRRDFHLLFYRTIYKEMLLETDTLWCNIKQIHVRLIILDSTTYSIYRIGSVLSCPEEAKWPSDIRRLHEVNAYSRAGLAKYSWLS
jgi:hypothetical protein